MPEPMRLARLAVTVFAVPAGVIPAVAIAVAVCIAAQTGARAVEHRAAYADVADLQLLQTVENVRLLGIVLPDDVQSAVRRARE